MNKVFSHQILYFLKEYKASIVVACIFLAVLLFYVYTKIQPVEKIECTLISLQPDFSQLGNSGYLGKCRKENGTEILVSDESVKPSNIGKNIWVFKVSR